MILECTTSRQRPWRLAMDDLDVIRDIDITLSTDTGETVGTSSLGLLRLADCERINAAAVAVLDEHSPELSDYILLVSGFGWSAATLRWLDDMPGFEPDYVLIARNTTLEPAWRGQGLAEITRLTRRWAPLGYQPMITFGEDQTFAIHGLDVNEAVDDLRAIVAYDGRIDRVRRRSAAAA